MLGEQEVVLKGGVLPLLARTGARDDLESYADACKRCFRVIVRPLGSDIDRQCEPDTSHMRFLGAPARTPPTRASLRFVRGCGQEHADKPHPLPLLRVRGERRDRHRAAS